ncbi:MAG: hypothetical protein ACOCQR_03415 [bacterium]
MRRTLENKISQIIDSFLSEAKDQYGNERTLVKLNYDRHLATEELKELFKKENKKIKEEIEEEIKEDLDKGKFNWICSNESSFKEYIFSKINDKIDIIN